MNILVAEFYCILLHIAIDHMKYDDADELSLISIVCDECKGEENILFDALKMNIDRKQNLEYELRTPFQHLIENRSARVNFLQLIYSPTY